MQLVLVIAMFGLHWIWPGADSEQKELRALHQTAEVAMNHSDYAAAKEAYQEIAKKVIPPFSQAKNPIEWTSYVDLLMRLAQVHLKLEEYEEGDQVLSNLMATSPPSEFHVRILLLQARLRCGNTGGQEAYLAMKKVLTQSPQEEWTPEDRSLFSALEYSLNATYDALCEKAKRYFVAGSFVEASGMYQELLDAIERGYYPKACLPGQLIEKKVRCRLAEAHYQSASYEKTLELIDTDSPAADALDRHMLYLAAMAYRERQAYSKALETFQIYLASAHPAELAHYNHARFEVAYAYYRAGSTAKAKELFSELTGTREEPAQFAALYLTRLYLEEGAWDLAEAAANKLVHPALGHEAAYLRGKIAFERGEFEKARSFFEEALPKTKFEDRFGADVYYHLGLCYLKTATQLGRAQSIFEKLGDERSQLALAKLHLINNQRDKTISFLGTRLLSFSLEGQVHALLLCAEAADDPRPFLQQAADPRYATAPSYGVAWYTLGLNLFEEGDPQTLAEAAAAFEKAFLLFQSKDKKRAAESLKMEAKATLARQAPVAALALVERLLGEFSTTDAAKEEALYLKGLVASRIEGEPYFALATETLEQITSGGYADSALNVLGSLYFQKGDYVLAQNAFLRLVDEYPLSQYAGEALFWAAESTERLGENASALHQRIWQDYPTSAHADEAYFRHFALDAYLRGEEKALAHLKTFSQRFPHSPIRIIASYLLGTHEPCVAFAKREFRDAITTFDALFAGTKSPDVAYLFFYFRARLELAQTLLTYGEDPTEANTLLKNLATELQAKGCPLKEGGPYPSLQEECEFTLAQSYLKLGKVYFAQQTFAHMLATYARYEITEGYHLARVWMEEGKLSLACEDFETAGSCLQMATECGKHHLTAEDKLTLWMLESDLYRGKNELAEAMRMLSKVINEDVVSPLRLKAMLKRAEIYELQGRRELAIRQLEATAKKGGEWGVQAQEKLKEKYGMDS